MIPCCVSPLTECILIHGSHFYSVLILYFSSLFFPSDTSTRSVSNSLFDTETIDISKMIKEILNIIAVNVRFFTTVDILTCIVKLFQHKINWQEILVTTKLYSVLPYQMFLTKIVK